MANSYFIEIDEREAINLFRSMGCDCYCDHGRWYVTEPTSQRRVALRPLLMRYLAFAKASLLTVPNGVDIASVFRSF